MLVRRKISLGFVIVGFILLLSSLIAIFEFYTMRNTVSRIVVNDIDNINSTAELVDITESYNRRIIALLQDTSIDVKSEISAIKSDKTFFKNLDTIRKNIEFYYSNKLLNRTLDRTLLNIVDSVRYTYFAHIYHIAQLQNKVDSAFVPYDWYMETFFPNHTKLIGHIKELSKDSHEAFISHSQSLNESFRRSLMPCIVAVVIGIILLFLFNYFLNFYFLSPLEKITKGINSYIVTKRSYDYNLTSDDEMQDLNDSVRELITENRKLIKEKNQ